MDFSTLDILKKGQIAVACNDAGAANIIINWLKFMPEVTFRVHLGGPAEALWNRAFPGTINYGLDDAMNGSSMLLSGTGWATSLEHKARYSASNNGIFSVAVIDHWVNYESRFFRNGRFIYPDQIWVVDKYGYDLAKSAFSNQVIKLMPNYYLDEQVRKIKEFEKTFLRNTEEKNILYALEPIRVSWKHDEVIAGEFQALDYFVNNLSEISRGPINMRLRPHPSDNPGKYDDWVGQQNLDAKIDISEGTPLFEDVAWSDIVVGCQTYVLIIGLTAGKRSISCLPPYAPDSLLPYPEIEEFRKKTKVLM